MFKVLYHGGGCTDGFSAAWVVNKWLTSNDVDEFNFEPVNYQQPPPKINNDDFVIIVDFSYPLKVLQEMAATARSVLVLDHHKTAQENLRGVESISYEHWFKNLLYDYLEKPRLWAVFDMEKSGAELAWQFFHSNDPQPKLIDYVADRDLFKNQLPYTKEITEYLKVAPQHFYNWNELGSSFENSKKFTKIVHQGNLLLQAKFHNMRDLLSTSTREWTIDGHKVPVCNMPHYLASDAGHLLTQDKPFSATYFDVADRRIVSLRSTDNGLDVSIIARKYGGGGHRNAAGFSVPFTWEGDAEGKESFDSEAKRALR